jgi:phosphatidylglycerol:prolipoprotein diacylglycerol transferase
MGDRAVYVHRLDPIMADLAGVYLWYYGLSYTLGFLGVFFWVRYNRARFGLTSAAAYDAGIFLALGVLIGGRLVEVVFYEWDFYSGHPQLVPAYWLGGMATHGILLGTAVACWGYSRVYRIPFLVATDELVIAGAFIMGLARLGNFVDGQIIGAPTDAWWGVVFPETDGPRHPVVLYDGLKNLLLIPLLLWLRRLRLPRGMVTAHFVFWYGFLRIFVDLFREYRVDVFGLGPGQVFNIAMALTGLLLFAWVRWRRPAVVQPAPLDGPFDRDLGNQGLRWRRATFAVLVLFPLVIPSDWTQDVPARYEVRHPGLTHSALYPEIPERAPAP